MTDSLVQLVTVFSAIHLSLSCLYPAQPIVNRSTSDFLYCHPEYGPSCPDSADCQYRWLGYYICCDQHISEKPLIGANPILLNSGILEVTGNATSMLTVDSDPNNSIWSNIWAMLTKPHKVTTESNKTFPGKVIRLNSSEFAWRFKWKEVATPTPKYPIILQNGVAANVSRDLNPIQLSTKTTRHTISLNSTVDTLGLWTRNSTNETVDYSWEGPDLTDNHTATNYTLPFPPKFTPIAGSPINNETSDNETGSVRAIYQHFSNNSQPHGTFNSTNKSANRTHLNTTDQLINVNETISDLEEYQNETILNILNVTNKMAHFYQQMNTSMRFDNVTLMVNTSAANSTIELIGLLESQWNETLVETKSTTRNSPKTTKQTSKRPKFAVVTGATSKEESNFLKQLKQFQSAVDSALLKD